MKKIYGTLTLAALIGLGAFGSPEPAAAQETPACHEEVTREDGTLPGDGCDEVGNPYEGTPSYDPRFSSSTAFASDGDLPPGCKRDIFGRVICQNMPD